DTLSSIALAMGSGVLILLGLYFRSFLTPFIPLVIIGISVAVAFGFMGVVSAQIDMFYLLLE
ncbi:MMPL family transporter, partial [Morganella morganii]|uniref:MMPL family transporter n=1 Tax=Morganella morganii TaxID=582 RepID=UPI0019548994